MDFLQVGKIVNTHALQGEVKVVSTEGEEIGEITEILEPGANDVWVVKRPGQKDALIPYIEDVVKAVDIEAKQVTIQVLEGLL